MVTLNITLGEEEAARFRALLRVLQSTDADISVAEAARALFEAGLSVALRGVCDLALPGRMN
jgi:hypothetical protein